MVNPIKPRMPIANLKPPGSGMGAQTGMQGQPATSKQPAAPRPQMPQQAPAPQAPSPVQQIANRFPSMGQNAMPRKPNLSGVRPTVQPPPNMSTQSGQWGKVQQRSGPQFTGAGQGAWQQSMNYKDPLYAALPPELRGRGREVTHGNITPGQGAGGVQASQIGPTGYVQERGHYLPGATATVQATGGPQEAAAPETVTPPPQSGGGASTGGQPSGGVATRSQALTTNQPPPANPPPAQGGQEQQGQTTPSEEGQAQTPWDDPATSWGRHGDSQDDILKDQIKAELEAAGLDPGNPMNPNQAYIDAYNKRMAELGAQYEGAPIGTTVDADMADAWNWGEDAEGNRIDSQGNTWEPNGQGGFQRVDLGAGKNKRTGEFEDLPEDKVVTENGQRVVVINGVKHVIPPGEDSQDFIKRVRGKGGGGVSPEIQAIIDAGNNVPQMDNAAWDARQKATDEMFASKSADAMRAGLVGAARAGMSPEAMSGMTAEIGHRGGLAAADANSQLGMQREVANFQAQMRSYDNRIEALKLAWASAQDEGQKQQAMAELLFNMNAKKGVEQQMLTAQMRMNNNLNSPNAWDYVSGGVNMAANVADAIIPG